MKKILLLFALCLPIFVKAQVSLPRDSITKKVVFMEIVNAPKQTQKQLFSKALKFMTEDYGDSFKINDAVAGKLSIEGSMSYKTIVSSTVIKNDLDYVLTIVVKNNKYRYTFSNFVLNENFGIGDPQKGALEHTLDTKNPQFLLLATQHNEIIQKKMKEHIAELKKSMTNPDDF